jgi:hypothetical protein
MSASAQQFPYVPRDPALGQASLAPMLPLTLIGRQRVTTSGLVDSGAAVNVLPYALGVQLGFDWDQQRNRSSCLAIWPQLRPASWCCWQP